MDEFGKFRLKGFEAYEYRIEVYEDKENNQKQMYAKRQIISKDNKIDDFELILDQSY